MTKPDRRPLAEARERCDQQPLHAERRPVALRVLDQLVGLADPDGAPPAFEPIVEQDAGDLAALAGASAVAEKPAAPKADRVLGVVARGGDKVEGLIDRPRPGEEIGMGLAGVDDAFELRVREHAIGDQFFGKMWPVGRFRRRDRGHRRGLHQLRWMRLRAGNTDRLKDVFLIKRIRETGALGWCPVHGLVGKLDTFGLGDGRRR